jgi:hypothetical protein
MSSNRRDQLAADVAALKEAVRKAQAEPGIADLMELMRESAEIDQVEREQRAAAVATIVVTTSSTSG